MADVIALAVTGVIGAALGWAITLFALGEDSDRRRNLALEWKQGRRG